jgi:hypothetical protein
METAWVWLLVEPLAAPEEMDINGNVNKQKGLYGILSDFT